MGDSPNTPPIPAQAPVELKDLKRGRRYEVAAGAKAIMEVAEYGLRHSGLIDTVRTALTLNQPKGFDCQSCAWPNPDEKRSVAEFCENGFKAVTYEVTKKKLSRAWFKKYSVEALAEKSDHWLGHEGRIVEPMVLRPDGTHYEPIEWTEAFELIARELKALSSPDEAVFYTSGRTSNEAAFLYQLFARAYGTNNLPDCSNMCHESTSVALPPMIGIGKGCVKLGDFPLADAIFIVGQNPGTNHPRMLTALQEAKEHGCKIVSINPLAETGNFRFKNPQDLLHPTRMPRFLFGPGTALSDLWLPVTINGDMACWRGILKELLEAEDQAPGTIFDQTFIKEHTSGYEALAAEIRATPWERIVSAAGLSRERIGEAVQIIRQSKRIIICWCMGVTQHKNAVATIQEMMNFLLLTGNIGLPGAGPCPVRGHSNVQGDRTMGIWDKPKEEFLEKLGKACAFDPPRKHGFDVVESFRAMHEGRAKVFIGMGGNLLAAGPDTEFAAVGMRQCALTAYVSIKMNRSHLVTGRTALILPCLGRTEIDRQASGEQFVTTEDSMGVINSSRGSLKPPSKKLLSEPAIIAGIAKATLGEKNPIDWDAFVGNYDVIRDRIEAVIPGFSAFNERTRQGTFYLPNPPRDERRFETPSKKAVLMTNPLTKAECGPGQYLLTTMRSHDQFNTSLYGLDDRYRGIYNGRRVIFLNPADVEEAGLMQGQLVDITSHFDGETRRVERFMIAPYDIPRRCAAAYYPEANPLVAVGSVAEKSNCPASKSVVITLASSSDQSRFD